MNRNLFLAIACMTIIAILTLLSAIPIGFHIKEETLSSVPASEVIPIIDEGKGYGMMPGPIVHRLYFENTFMPRQYVLPRATACLYNSKTRQGAYINARWQISALETKVSDFSQNENVVQLGRESRTVELSVDQFVRWQRMPQYTPEMTEPVKPVPLTEYAEGFDTIYLWLIDKDAQQNFYPMCENIQPADVNFAKKIMIV